MHFPMKGRHPGTEGNGPERPHEHYFELCALATTGTLADAEWKDLRQHLSVCSECAELARKYREISRVGMSLLVKDEAVTEYAGEPSWSPELATRELHARIERGEQSGWSGDSIVLPQPGKAKGFWARIQIPTWRLAPRYAIAFALIVVAIGSAYRIGVNAQQRSVSAAHASDSSKDELPEIEQLKQQKDLSDKELAARNGQIEILSKQVETATTNLTKLTALKRQLDQNLQERGTELSQLHSQSISVVTERDKIARSLQDAQELLSSMKSELDRLREERTASLLRTSSLENRIADLSARLKKQDDLGAVDAQLLSSDRDIRELMGARELYIADVYDVDSSGRTETSFGRVFYTKGKSLVFYAFDLDRHRGVRNASTFQAWGRRGLHDERPVNMGIFYLDSETNRRWVLKFDDPNTLARIDSVFVTVEPRGGSQEPRGKAFLVASLRSQPNHP